jgi:hypothetical protein
MAEEDGTGGGQRRRAEEGAEEGAEENGRGERQAGQGIPL